MFLAIAYASRKESANFKGVSGVANGINHAIPNHNELQKSIKWLLEKELIVKSGKKYTLSGKGSKFISHSKEHISTTSELLKMIEQTIKSY